MNELREIAARCRAALAADGISDRYCFLILTALANDDTWTFDEVVESMSFGYREVFRDKKDVHAHVAVKMKRAGIAGNAEDYFAQKVKEVMTHES